MTPINPFHFIMDYFCPLSEPEQKLDIDPKIEIIPTDKPKEQEWGKTHFGD